MRGNLKRENREIPSVAETVSVAGRFENLSEGKSNVNADGKSDRSVVPSTRANNDAAEASAESAEERDRAKRNAESSDPPRSPKRKHGRSLGLTGVRITAREQPELKFTSLLHHVNEQLLHKAFDALNDGLTSKRINWMLDADVKGFFDNVDHEWLIKFLEHRIGDKRVLRLIRKWLRAGVSDEGEWSETTVGTPQGAVASPLLANVYLHYVLDLWIQWWRENRCRGDVVIVRYADDFVIGFQSKAEAEACLTALHERFGKSGLELHPEKTRLIEFGRYAISNRQRRGAGRPETFDFLGFTHRCYINTRGYFTVRRATIAKRMRATLAAIKRELIRRRHRPLGETGRWLRRVLQGWLGYHTVPGNMRRLQQFRMALGR
jgi:group II intron reverse transcriptase/maturase